MWLKHSKRKYSGLSSYFLAGSSGFLAISVLLWKVTGIVISADWIAGLGSGASTVRRPSGERDEATLAISTPGGRLKKKTDHD